MKRSTSPTLTVAMVFLAGLAMPSAFAQPLDDAPPTLLPATDRSADRGLIPSGDLDRAVCGDPAAGGSCGSEPNDDKATAEEPNQQASGRVDAADVHEDDQADEG